MQVDQGLTRDPNRKCGCLFVDIDHFKIYNDRWGHSRETKSSSEWRVSSCAHVRVEESVIRIGGDEFVVILHDTDAAETKLVADRLRAEALDRAPVPFSLGWASREPGEPLQRVWTGRIRA